MMLRPPICFCQGKNVYEVIGVQKYIALCKKEKNEKNQHPNPAQHECHQFLWMMPSISPLITCKTLHCCAPSVTSTQNKRQPTSNPQNPGFNNRGLRRLRPCKTLSRSLKIRRPPKTDPELLPEVLRLTC